MEIQKMMLAVQSVTAFKMPCGKESVISRGKHLISQKDLGSVHLAVWSHSLHVKLVS